MNNLLGKILNGTTGNGTEAVTFEVVDVQKTGGDTILTLECVEYGMPLQSINVNNINQPVPA